MKLFNDVNYNIIAKLIASKHIVCIFQGRSEGGPRALGNRSILFDPRDFTDVSFKSYINQIKGREWYRPVAGSILEEKTSEYFDMKGLKSTPFMTYAVKTLSLEHSKKILSIVTYDNTCRIQTVNEEQNYHYYNLIKSFYELTGVPIIGNTSFNLGGEPIVETIEDAISVIQRSEIEFLYLPEKSKLILSENK
jgi:carbamoyltransferase